MGRIIDKLYKNIYFLYSVIFLYIILIILIISYGYGLLIETMSIVINGRFDAGGWFTVQFFADIFYYLGLLFGIGILILLLVFIFLIIKRIKNLKEQIK